jgi:LmbE family N-acetylglucosaminyl deacetylase
VQQPQGHGRLLEWAPARVLAIYAHPDDPAIACGGTLARWARGGAEVHVVVCTLGDKGAVDDKISTEALVALRAEEARRAAELLGVATQRGLGHRDGEIDASLLYRQLVEVVRQFRPEVVLCPDPTAVFFGDAYYNHRDHRTTGYATLDALSPAASSVRYFPELGPPHAPRMCLMTGTLEPAVWVDVGEVLDVKAEAVACHASQFDDPGASARRLVEQRAADEGRRAGVAYAEGFRRLLLGL